MEGVFSLKERYPTMNLQDTFAIPADILINIFGENDIKIQVPDKNNFLNPDQVGTQKFEDDKKLLLDLINNIRSQNGIETQPVDTYSADQIAEIKALKEYQKAIELERAYIEDPIRAKNEAWQQKLLCAYLIRI